MKNMLEKIINDKKESLILIKKNNSLDSLDLKIKNFNSFYNFKKSIEENEGISLISEIKKASPSAGIIVNNFNHLEIAKVYFENGATCLSVLTEEKNFLGKLDFISDIKNNFPSCHLSILCPKAFAGLRLIPRSSKKTASSGSTLASFKAK